jgi:hypothetical protein
MTLLTNKFDFIIDRGGVQTHNIPERSPKITETIRVLTMIGFGSDPLIRYTPPKKSMDPIL